MFDQYTTIAAILSVFLMFMDPPDWLFGVCLFVVIFFVCNVVFK